MKQILLLLLTFQIHATCLTNLRTVSYGSEDGEQLAIYQGNVQIGELHYLMWGKKLEVNFMEVYPAYRKQGVSLEMFKAVIDKEKPKRIELVFGFDNLKVFKIHARKMNTKDAAKRTPASKALKKLGYHLCNVETNRTKNWMNVSVEYCRN